MRKTRLLFITFSIFFALQNIGAVETVTPKPKFIYKVDNLTYFDNRMFYLPYHKSKMFFGDRLTALVGIGINSDGDHKLYTGVTAMVPFGTDFKSYTFLPMVYYRFQQKFDTKLEQNLKLHFGILPYREMEMSLPSFIRKGSSEYSAPNLQGVLAQYQLKINEKSKLSLEYVADWRKAKNKTQRDNYGMILDGKISAAKIMDFGFIAQWDRLGYNTDAIKYNSDNVVFNAFAKADFGGFTKNFKSISLQIGYVGSFNNDSVYNVKQWNNSIVVDCGIQWKIITLKNSFYVSLNQDKDGNLMPLHKNVPDLYISDQYYRAPLYNKTELSFDLVNKSVFTLKATLAMHVVSKNVFSDLPDNKDYKQIGWQQKITANVKF